MAGMVVAPLGAATREPPDEARMGRGGAIEQSFLPNGLSIVSTPRGRSCVASARIPIAESSYRDEAGNAVPFERIVPSPAASVQAAMAAGTETPTFRIQLKFSPQPDTPITLVTGEGAAERRLDRSPDMEKAPTACSSTARTPRRCRPPLRQASRRAS